MKVGTRVRTNRDFVSLPKGSEGVIIEDYGSGFMVEWINTKPDWRGQKLRDGFNKKTELQFLEEIKDVNS